MHDIFTSGELAPVAKKIGLELLALQIPATKPGLHGPSLDNQVRYYYNQKLKQLKYNS